MIQLGKAPWSVAGVAAGHAMLTTGKQSRWVDLRTWPGKLLQLRDEHVQAVCEGATLAGARVWRWTAPDKKRTEVVLPSAGWLAIGVIGDELCVAGKTVMTASGKVLVEGGDAPLAAFGEGHVCCGGRVFRSLAVVDDLPRGIASVIGTGAGLVAVGGKKLVEIEGRRWTEHKLAVDATSVMIYDEGYLLGDGRRYWYYDAGKLEPFDLGVPEASALIAAPCGLIALIGTALLRLRV